MRKDERIGTFQFILKMTEADMIEVYKITDGAESVSGDSIFSASQKSRI